jgi:hypothetical protein
MRIEIDTNILSQTTECGRDFACLADTGKLCRVENCVNNKVHFIECRDDAKCNYQISFGYSYICTCPTRKEIYNRYGL